MPINRIIRRTTQRVPAGYILGRLPGTGDGPAQLLNLRDLTAFGVASASAAGPAAHDAGFGFNDGGLLGAGEYLGAGTWAHDVTFQNGNPGTSVTSLVPANANATFNIQTYIAGILTTVGTIEFLAGTTVGVVTWLSPPVTIPAGVQIKLFAPSPADSTLASVTGIVVGTAVF